MNSLPSAVFLDRDGTIIEDAHYLSRPEQVRLIPGAAAAIARINALLLPVIVVTNQSGIGRGIFSREDHGRVTERVDELLGQGGARIDAAYFCPHAPEDDCQCRKPRKRLFEQAAADHRIDLARALYLGDRLRDIEPGLELGGDGVLIPSPETPQDEIVSARQRARVASSLGVALDWFLCTN
ncbi:MAG TPA: HAD family hydrolase [Gemmatimonadaceae bacterium]|nr:HAD family hydrolase [Gemmatimonadaceae bacterium]